MSEPFIGEIRMFGGNFAPRGWAPCDGSLLSISENSVLYTLLGTTYGGDGQTTFGLPDLRGRVPIHIGTLQGGPTFTLGERAGSETVTVTTAQLAAHSHALLASRSPADGADPTGNVLAGSDTVNFYGPANPDKSAAMNPAFIGPAGGSQPHENMQPFLCVSFIIALDGIYPSQS